MNLNLLLAVLLRTLDHMIHLYIYTVIAAAIFVWLVIFNIADMRKRPVAYFGFMLYTLTEPPLRPIRRFLPDLGRLDLAPLVLVAGLVLVRLLLWQLVLLTGYRY